MAPETRKMRRCSQHRDDTEHEARRGVVGAKAEQRGTRAEIAEAIEGLAPDRAPQSPPVGCFGGLGNADDEQHGDRDEEGGDIQRDGADHPDRDVQEARGGDADGAGGGAGHLRQRVGAIAPPLRHQHHDGGLKRRCLQRREDRAGEGQGVEMPQAKAVRGEAQQQEAVAQHQADLGGQHDEPPVVNRSASARRRSRRWRSSAGPRRTRPAPGAWRGRSGGRQRCSRRRR